MNMRIGQGYDVHRLVMGRRLMLGGVEIPYVMGLEGHSDADVLLHAVMDSMLGALALGDIGALFPDTEAVYAGADSGELLRQVRAHLFELGWQVANLDSTVVAQQPKLSPYIPAMRERIAKILAIPLECVSVKATTEERLGFTGREEGIAAQAVCLLEYTARKNPRLL